MTVQLCTMQYMYSRVYNLQLRQAIIQSACMHSSHACFISCRSSRNDTQFASCLHPVCGEVSRTIFSNYCEVVKAVQIIAKTTFANHAVSYGFPVCLLLGVWSELGWRMRLLRHNQIGRYKCSTSMLPAFVCIYLQ